MANIDAAADPVEDEAPIESTEVDTEDEEVEVEEEAEESEGEANEPSESSTEKKGDKFQDRIDEVTKKFREQERRTIELEQQLREQAEAKAPPPEPLAPDKTLADFEYDESAFATYLTQFARQAAEAEVTQRAEKTEQARRRSEFTAKEADFAVNVDDYHRVTRNQDLPVNQYMVEALQTAEKGPEVLYYLGKNPEETRRLSQMSPLDMARELGKIEATKLVKPEKSIKANAPPPPKLKATDSTTRISSASADSDKLSDAEWLKRERKRIAAKG